MEQQLLRIQDVCKRIGLRRSTIYRMLAEKRFPQPVQLGERARAWPASEVDQWVKNKILERDQAAQMAEREAA